MSQSQSHLQSPSLETQPDGDGRLGAAISDALVAVIRDAVGRGPQRARTFVHDDVIICLLHETMTPLERTLHAEQRDDTVREVRDVLHAALAPQASSASRRSPVAPSWPRSPITTATPTRACSSSCCGR